MKEDKLFYTVMLANAFWAIGTGLYAIATFYVNTFS